MMPAMEPMVTATHGSAEIAPGGPTADVLEEAMCDTTVHRGGRFKAWATHEFTEAVGYSKESSCAPR